jgi:T5SS/PEP-CTERM-associated repeat protein
VGGESSDKNANFTTFGDTRIGSQIIGSELFVEDGGHVSSTGLLEVGANSSELGHATVSGSDAILSSGTLRVGKEGRGNLTITGGATVITRQNATVGASTQAISSVPPPTSGGTGAGIVTIIGDPVSASLWHVNGNCTVGVDEPGSITLSGTPFLGGPTLRVDARLDNGIHGIIAGNGTLAAVSIVNAGFISPGLSPGALTIEGDFEQKPEGTLRMEIAGLDDGQFDVLKITGNAKLGGTLLVTFIDGFVPEPGDNLPFLQVAGILEGEFANVQSEGLPEGSALVIDSATGIADVRIDCPRGKRTLFGMCGAGVCGMLPMAVAGMHGLRRRHELLSHFVDGGVIRRRIPRFFVR